MPDAPESPDAPAVRDAAEVSDAADAPDATDATEARDSAGTKERDCTKERDFPEATSATEARESAEASDGAGPRDDAGNAGDPAGPPVVRDAVSAPDAQGRPRRVTRRFPLFTRDTARPEGGGRAAPKDAPAPARQWPILLLSTVAGIGLLLTAFGLFRPGTVVIGCGLLLGAVLRWTVPNVGILAVRSRFTDVVTYGLLGVVIVLLALMVEPEGLEIPFLKDLLHFTVDEG
ncbi:DUF3017 domain-containing protein [Streptomyces sp. CO7]